MKPPAKLVSNSTKSKEIRDDDSDLDAVFVTNIMISSIRLIITSIYKLLSSNDKELVLSNCGY